MADLPIRVPLSNNDAEEYEEPINVHRDAVGAAAFYIQPSTEGDEHDALVGIERDSQRHLWLKDQFTRIEICALAQAANTIVKGLMQMDGTFVIDSNGEILVQS
jgi:DNA integrity scanning protein DisA with diadenylate cyclase activity